MTPIIGRNEEHKINKLYYELIDIASGAIFAAIEIGELLSAKKKQLPPDEWLPWLTNNVKFDEATAVNYIAAFQNADQFELVAFDDYVVTCQPACLGSQPSPTDYDDLFLE
jgi:hypothetical protein